ncbi:MAG: ribbon-helix-helix protein, CopG family [Anaerolineales bacterium]|nr:ribbon-helix-helix protein, CopG family [Anaerolineales bacterium]MCA9931880.1 ribbon-helix-helix protein, CopG family [Anaerolineales bacterium]
MIRTQIQLTEDQSRILKAMSREQNVSIAELIRQSVEQFIHTSNRPTPEGITERLLSIAGKYSSGVADLSANHDDYLAEAYGVVGK